MNIAVRAATVTTRIVVEARANRNSGGLWEPLRCDGTDVLNGVGIVRMRVYGTSDTNKLVRMRRDYALTDLGRGQDSPWYDDAWHYLPANQEVEVAEIIQDIDPRWENHRFAAKPLNPLLPGIRCDFKAFNVPPTNDGVKSHRTFATDYAESLRIEVNKYAPPKEPTPCDGPIQGRMEVRVFATNDKDAILDFHFHQETEFGTGPDQDGDPRDRRYWEQSINDVKMVGGVEKLVADFVTDLAQKQPDGTILRSYQNAFHFAQQTVDGEQPHNEIFCLSDPDG